MRAGSAFPAFPYPAYDIQLDFMRQLYSALDQGGVGLFESPTGELLWATLAAAAPPYRLLAVVPLPSSRQQCSIAPTSCRNREDPEPHLCQPSVAARPEAQGGGGGGGGGWAGGSGGPRRLQRRRQR